MLKNEQKIHDFQKSLLIGKNGEDIVEKLIMQTPSTFDYIDVRNNQKYRDMDIDYLVLKYDGTYSKIEIKTDTHTSGNLFYETISSVETDSIGCMLKTKCDKLVYLFINLDLFYIFDMWLFRNWVTANTNFLKENYQVELKNKYKDGFYTSVGYAIPLNLLDQQSFTYKKHLIFK